jgi:hypothetical protein
MRGKASTRHERCRKEIGNPTAQIHRDLPTP